MCVCPELLNSPDIPSDAKEKARKILSHTKGSSMGKLLKLILLLKSFNKLLIIYDFLKHKQANIKVNS